MTGDTLRVCLWSGPRNVSTALMYSFARRADTVVLDEPLYAHYLVVSGEEHPGRDEVLAAQDHDGRRVMRDQVLGACDRPVLFAKQMAHHLVGDLEPERALDCLGQVASVLLVRDPEEVLLSLSKVIGDPRPDQTGVPLQAQLLDLLSAHDPDGAPPPVLDARRLRMDPEGVLRRLCAALGLEFDPAMLSWPAGPIPEDGVWAPHWYGSVHRSTGWQPWSAPAERLPARLRPVADACRESYERLLELAL